MVNSHINLNQEIYLKALTNALPWTPPFETMTSWTASIEIMRTSLVVGYLTLESERWLRPNRGEGNVGEFDGISFINVCRYVRSMEDLGEWMVKTVSPRRFSPILVGLSVFVPGLGGALHEERIIPSIYTKSLVDLITSLEKEDWGIDLP
jgi:hypothetical protein